VSASALAVSGLGKAFRSYRSEWQRVLSWLGAPVKPSSEQWVLRDIEFAIAPGEAVAIVGQNGAGKSTLLKLVAGTMRPSEGSVEIAGRVAAILELGMGFNPELTGRQNALHAGGLMGFDRKALRATMPAIEVFADIADYFDKPLRIYSSGMQVRVAFAVATAFRPEILIIDEALAVGDAAFQRKCFQRIEAFRRDGTTLLFVSHDLETVKKICSRAAFLNAGRLVRFGPAKQVCDEYEQHLFGAVARPPAQPSSTPNPTRFDPALAATSCEVVYGDGRAEIESCWVENGAGERVNVIPSDRPFVWRYEVRFNEVVDDPVFAMLVKTREGVTIYGVDSKQLNVQHRRYLPGELVDVRFELSNRLGPGIYYLNCGVRLDLHDRVEFVSRRVDAAMVRIVDNVPSTIIVGLVNMKANLVLATTSIAVA
jgi:lipopolysaccharide transport system ATP-binding protein